MNKQKKRRGDRKDAWLVRDAGPMHMFMPYILPNRADNEAFISEQVDLTRINEYLEKKNADVGAYKYTIFHVIAAALAKTIILRPKMNRFISGRRLYQRRDLILSFVAKKIFSDDGEEILIFQNCGDDCTIDTLHDEICEKVSKERKKTEGSDHTTNTMGWLVKIPRFLLRIVMGILNMLDYYGRVPAFIGKEDPYSASVFISNLGSIKLHAGYHHLTNWGTNSIFLVIGEKHKAPFYDDEGNVKMKEVLELGITLDERIADGYYYSKTVKLLKFLLQNPELLELSAKEEVDFENTNAMV